MGNLSYMDVWRLKQDGMLWRLPPEVRGAYEVLNMMLGRGFDGVWNRIDEDLQQLIFDEAVETLREILYELS